MQEVRLWNNRREQEALEKLGDLYAIIQTTERLEHAFTTDKIPAAEYEPLCERLIAQYRTLYNAIRDVVPDTEQFMAEYHMTTRYAAARLRSGLPATIQHRNPRSNQDGVMSADAVADIAVNFLTCTDSLKLNMVAVDQVSPLLKDLMRSMNRLLTMPADCPSKQRIAAWLEKLHNLPANYELQEGEVRQLLFELEASYQEFRVSINTAA